MILDGYTQHGAFDNRRFSYRPAVYAERTEFLRGHHTREAILGFIQQHIVWSDGDWETWHEKEKEVLFLICFGKIPPEKGGDWTPDWEVRDARNLREGVILDLLHPQVAKRNCEDCKKWWYDEKTGAVAKKGSRYLLRPTDVVTLCETREGCPKGTPENQRCLSPKNKQAWRHYQECAAVGSWPDDAIVKQNARIIRRAMEEARRQKCLKRS